MKKRILSVVLAVALAFGMNVGTAKAAETNQTVVEPQAEQGAEVRATGASFATATGIAMGQTISGTITEQAAERLYRFALSSSGCVTLNLNSYMEYYTVQVYNSAGEEVWYSDNNKWNENLKYRSDSHKIELTKGSYYLKVAGHSFHNDDYPRYTGSYNFSTKFVSAGETYAEPNNDFSSAPYMNLNGTVKGQIAENDAYDIYRFSMPSAGRLNVKMTSYMQYYTMQVYDSNGKEIWYSDYNEWNENLKYRSDAYKIDLAKGNYYLKITGFTHKWYDSKVDMHTGNYTFTTSFISAGETCAEPNNDFSHAYKISTDKVIKGQIAENDAYDVMKFTLSSARDVKLAITSYMEYYTACIYDTNGSEVWYSEHNQWNENVGYRKDTHVITLSAGSYYLKMTGCRWKSSDNDLSTGTYTVSVNTKAAIKDAVVKKVSNRVYTGKAIKPSLSVTFNGKKLKSGKDYTLSYRNNKAIGTATVTITGKGNYAGTKKVSFKIVPKNVNLTGATNRKGKNVTLKWKKDSAVSGYEVYRSNSRNAGYKKIKVISSKNTTNYKNTKLKKGRTYYYKVRAYKKVNGKKIYGGYSNIRKVKVTK